MFFNYWENIEVGDFVTIKIDTSNISGWLRLYPKGSIFEVVSVEYKEGNVGCFCKFIGVKGLLIDDIAYLYDSKGVVSARYLYIGKWFKRKDFWLLRILCLCRYLITGKI